MKIFILRTGSNNNFENSVISRLDKEGNETESQKRLLPVVPVWGIGSVTQSKRTSPNYKNFIESCKKQEEIYTMFLNPVKKNRKGVIGIGLIGDIKDRAGDRMKKKAESNNVLGWDDRIIDDAGWDTDVYFKKYWKIDLKDLYYDNLKTYNGTNSNGENKRFPNNSIIIPNETILEYLKKIISKINLDIPDYTLD